MKFRDLSFGDQFTTVSPISWHTTRDIFTRVDTSQQPLAEQRACNALFNGVLIKVNDDTPVNRKLGAGASSNVWSMDISSGFGIGGAGSDDYNMATEAERPAPQFSQRKSTGQLWEPCSQRGCDNEPSCLDCGYCLDNHCRCG